LNVLPAAPSESKRDILLFASGIALGAALAALAMGLWRAWVVSI